MHNLRTIGKNLFRFNSFSIGRSTSLILGFVLATGTVRHVDAQSTETVPAELKEVITEIEGAANRHDVEGVMKFYSSNFTNSDGLSYSSLSQALTKTWERYPKLSYSTKVESWERKGNEIVAETVTQLQGSQSERGRLVQLDSTVRSRQHFADGKIVKQEILAETTKLISGSNPPQIEINSPEKVRTGEQFNFDVIVTEPLGNDVLLGNIIEEETKSDRYLNPSPIDLKVLPGGGIFKIVKAPMQTEHLWFSAILVRGDGIIQFTQRVRVEDTKK